MPVTLVVGGQWGDEGKAKIIDVLAPAADFVVRYQGGANAGHTVVAGGERFAFHLVPSGILYPGVQCVLGGGMVIDPCALIAEIRSVRSRGVDVDGRILVSDQAHLVLPYHVALDEGSEKRLGNQRIGTTGKGISPAYMDKIGRSGVRMGDLRRRPTDLEELLRNRVRAKNRVLKAHGHRVLSPGKVVADVMSVRARLLKMITDTRPVLWDAVDARRRVLCEGAQGVLLDVDHGTYPFVTSSSPAAGGACTGTGLPPTAIDRVIGVFKAYCTRVGNGPFPTEDAGRDGARMREVGHEFGTTTGRPRRCGWFDGVAARTAVRLNGVTEIALTKLDVLDALDTLKVCTSYRVRGRELHTFPSDARSLDGVRPVYEAHAGWDTTSTVRKANEVPAAAMDYVEAIERHAGARISMLSLGPQRSALVRLPRRRKASARRVRVDTNSTRR